MPASANGANGYDELVFGHSSHEFLEFAVVGDSADRHSHVLATQNQPLNDLKPHTVGLTGKILKTSSYPFNSSRHADIYEGRWIRGDGVIISVAIKTIRISNSVNWFPTEKARSSLVQEGQIWASLVHPNVAPFFGICYDPCSPGAPCFVTPYYPNGDVNAYLSKHPEVDRLQLVCQVAAGLNYLHSKTVPVVHGGIKSSNVLINNGQACLTDCGVSRMLECSGLTTTGRGFLRWMAPELFDNESANYDPHPSSATDVWAFAMCSLEIFTCRLPYFVIESDMSVILTISRGVLPQQADYPEIADNIWRILQACWKANPVHRPLTRELLNYLSDSNNLPSDLQTSDASVVVQSD